MIRMAYRCNLGHTAYSAQGYANLSNQGVLLAS